MRTAATLMDVVTIIACLLGGAQVLTSLMSADANAVQLASGVVAGIGVAAIPYMLAGALHRVAVRDSLAEGARRAD